MRSDRAATTAERQALSVVVERLEAELAPCRNRPQIDTEVSRILLGFEQGRGRGEVEEEILVGEYLAALRGLPLAAIQAAAERFRSGETLLPWIRRFRPSPAEFASEAREGLIPLRVRLLHARRVLDAEVIEVPTQAQRDAVAEASRAYLQRVPRGDGPGQHRRETPAEIQAVREAEIRDSVERLKASGRGPEIGRLIQHLDARRFPSSDGANQR